MKEINFDDKSDSEIKRKIIEITSKMDQRVLVIWASDCAEHVLSYFEEKYPNDDRPRKAIEAARAWVNGELSVGEVRSVASAAHTAARESEDDLSRAAARAAGHAIQATNYATKVDPKERIWQYDKLLDLKCNNRENSSN